MIHMGRERQSIVPVELFSIGASPPRFDMARAKVHAIREPGDSASFLEPLEIMAKHALSAPGLDEIDALGCSDVCALSDFVLRGFVLLVGSFLSGALLNRRKSEARQDTAGCRR